MIIDTDHLRESALAGYDACIKDGIKHEDRDMVDMATNQKREAIRALDLIEELCSVYIG